MGDKQGQRVFAFHAFGFLHEFFRQGSRAADGEGFAIQADARGNAQVAAGEARKGAPDAAHGLQHTVPRAYEKDVVPAGIHDGYGQRFLHIRFARNAAQKLVDVEFEEQGKLAGKRGRARKGGVTVALHGIFAAALEASDDGRAQGIHIRPAHSQAANARGLIRQIAHEVACVVIAHVQVGGKAQAGIAAVLGVYAAHVLAPRQGGAHGLFVAKAQIERAFGRR